MKPTDKGYNWYSEVGGVRVKQHYRVDSPIILVMLSAALGAASGCSMCCGPYDYHYPTFGGAVQRSDPVYGRVGSLYSDPGPFGGPSADSNLRLRDDAKKMPDSNGTRGLEDLDSLDDELDLERDNRNENSSPPRQDKLDPPGPDETTRLRPTRIQSLRNGSRWR